MHSTIIRSKEMSIINEEIPNKYFHLRGQQKQAKKTNKTTSKWKKRNTKTNLEILKECQQFYQHLYNKQQNCEKTQNELLYNIPKLVEIGQNKQLTNPINKSKLK